jgi:chemotaxis protein CheD
MADCAIGDVAGQVLTTYALGSCIGLAVHDVHSPIGGLLHFMLPDSAIDPARGREMPFMFADTGIPLLLQRMRALGATRPSLSAFAVGGAQIMDGQNVFAIGERNYLATRRILWKAGILLRGEAIGGTRPRTMGLEVGTGRIWLEEGGARVELTSPSGRNGGIHGIPGTGRR